MNLLLHICDSTLIKMHESACHCPFIVEKTVNTSNPEITKMVCGTLVILAIIAAITLLLWKLVSFWAESNKAKREHKNTIEDAKRKQIAEYRKDLLELKRDCHLVKDRKYSFSSTPNDSDPYVKALTDIINDIKGC